MNFYSQTKIQNTHTNSMKNFEFKSGKKNLQINRSDKQCEQKKKK